MKNKEVTQGVGFSVNKGLYDCFIKAVDAGLTVNGKKATNKSALEIGIKVLLGALEDESEEEILKKIQAIEIEETYLASKKKLLYEHLEKVRAKKQKEIEVCTQTKQDIQDLAELIISEWANIRIIRKKERIDSIAKKYQGRLNEHMLEKVFSEGGLDAPTKEEALKIASDLLEAGKDE